MGWRSSSTAVTTAARRMRWSRNSGRVPRSSWATSWTPVPASGCGHRPWRGGAASMCSSTTRVRGSRRRWTMRRTGLGGGRPTLRSTCRPRRTCAGRRSAISPMSSPPVASAASSSTWRAARPIAATTPSTSPMAPPRGACSRSPRGSRAGSPAPACWPMPWLRAGWPPTWPRPPTCPEIVAGLPLGEVTPPADVAEVIAFLASGRSPHTTGTTIDITGADYVR